MTDLPYRLGAKPDRPDPRDYRRALTPARAAVAAAIDRKMYTMVGPDFRINQGNEGTCVTHGGTNMLLAGPSEHDDYAAFATEETAHLFARDAYLRSSGDATYQQGMYPRDMCAFFKAEGLIESYLSVPQVDDVITALLTSGPVGVALPWYSSMFFGDGRLKKAYGNEWIKVNLESEHVGYHFIIYTAVDLSPSDGAPPWLRAQNSWGHDWLMNGTGRMTVESFRRLNIWDNWTFAERPF